MLLSRQTMRLCLYITSDRSLSNRFLLFIGKNIHDLHAVSYLLAYISAWTIYWALALTCLNYGSHSICQSCLINYKNMAQTLIIAK